MLLLPIGMGDGSEGEILLGAIRKEFETSFWLVALKVRKASLYICGRERGLFGKTNMLAEEFSLVWNFGASFFPFLNGLNFRFRSII